MLAAKLKSYKVGIRRQLKILRQHYVRTFQSFTPADLLQQLQDLGIRPGDTLLVHSSFDSFEGFTGKPSDVITTLMDAIGPTGTLLMPTLPFTSSAVDYANQNRVFDVTRTPSRMGLVSELFRRWPGVVRSVHPTHPVAVWGRDAESISAQHYAARTPCGTGTPFAQLLQRRGKILLLGVDISSLTFYHLVEEVIEARLPFSPFTQQLFQLQSKQQDGSLVTTETRLFEPAISRRRNLYKLVPELQRAQAWQERRSGRLTMTLLSAKAVHDTLLDMTERGIYCYD